MKLKDKTVVITGGSDGLGFSLAKLFINKGSNVFIIGRDKNKIENAVKSLGNNVKGSSADVSKLNEIQKIADDLERVDVLINAAGIWIEGSVIDNTEKEISDAIDINLKGVILSTKAFLPKLLKSNEAHIVNISSTSGLKGRSNQAVYVASKFGVTGFTDSLKEDLANTNVKVSGFYPGGMHTSLFEKAGKPKENTDWMDTNKVAEVIVFMIERDMTMIMDHVVLNKRNTKTSN
ncbi:MAG: SDR family oxidoreductase [Candidatus Gottesmanbacteria bacterium]